MNKFVRQWQRHYEKVRYDGPDAVVLEDAKVILTEEGGSDMGVEVKLPKQQFRNVIRQIKTADLNRVKVLRTATYNALKRLGVNRDPTKAVKGIPKGSDQGDVQSIVVWLAKVSPKDKQAVRQVVAIDATASQRVVG